MSIKIYFRGPEGRCEKRAKSPLEVPDIVKQVTAAGGRSIKIGASFHTAQTYGAWRAKVTSIDCPDAVDA